MTEGVKRALGSKLDKASPVLLSALDKKLDADMKIIRLDGFDLAQKEIVQLIKDNPDLGISHIKNVYAVSNSDVYAAVIRDSLFISSADDLIPGFKPAVELIQAFHRITNKSKLTFYNEYAIEKLTHEILHGASNHIECPKSPKHSLIIEGIHQWQARLWYPVVLNKLNETKALHTEKVLNSGLAYSVEVNNFRKMLRLLSLNEEQMYSMITSQWRTMPPEQIITNIAIMLSEPSGISEQKIKRMLNYLTVHEADFEAKVKQLLSY